LVASEFLVAEAADGSGTTRRRSRRVVLIMRD
jgi:hypothetical protein